MKKIYISPAVEFELLEVDNIMNIETSGNTNVSDFEGGGWDEDDNPGAGNNNENDGSDEDLN